MRKLLTLDEVAAQLGVSREWLYRNKRRLEKQHGFPGEFPGVPRRYDPLAITLWQNAQLPAALRDAPGAPAPAAPIEPEPAAAADWENVLDARAAAIAQSILQ